MSTFLAIMLYAALMFVGLATLSAIMVFLATWLSGNTEEPEVP